MIYVAAIVLAEGDSVATNRYNPPTEPKNQEYLANSSLYTFEVLFNSSPSFIMIKQSGRKIPAGLQVC